MFHAERTQQKFVMLPDVEFPATEVVMHLHRCQYEVLVDVLVDCILCVQTAVIEDDVARELRQPVLCLVSAPNLR